MKTEDLDSWVEKYVDDEMTPEEKVAFESELENNKKLQEALRLHQEIKAAICNKGLRKQRLLLKELYQQYHKPQHRLHSLFLYKRSLAVAGVVIILLAITTIILVTYSKSYTSQELFKKYYSPYEMKDDFSDFQSQHENDLYKEANLAYHDKNYESAIVLFKEIIHINKYNFHSFFYGGISAIQTNDLAFAEYCFGMIIELGVNDLVDHAKWYLAMVYLRKDDQPRVKGLLMDLLGHRNMYNKSARKIIKYLSI